ncbi:hypothetical protein HMF7854_08745 [Sphingomonas ginkgonis]|uniref:Circumsporozoite protein n=1 Tax=Sphingomonas ginkgonis TaxID=2315330 RepID=A0A429VAA0_9SPHN|nr:hypothetical protein [Sphingomonas ginkgonis]RST30919.1 hypothetical protein HMF7854_08745 [Sphingomonas ginkgonis]
MKKVAFALLATGALGLAACNNNNPDQVSGNVETNSAMTVNDTSVNEQVEAVNAEAEALGNQAAELNQVASNSAAANGSDNVAENVTNSDSNARDVNAM